MLGQNALEKAMFPVGGLTKAQVREIAEEAGLANSKKKDSTGVCFIGERHFKPFLQQFLPAQPGNMRTLEGKVVGRHDGLMYYTLGQRRGLGIGGAGNGERWFVLAKDMAHNELIVTQGADHPLLYSKNAARYGRDVDIRRSARRPNLTAPANTAIVSRIRRCMSACAKTGRCS